MHIPSVCHQGAIQLQRLHKDNSRLRWQFQQTPEQILHIGCVFRREVFVVDAQFNENEGRFVRDMEGGAKAEVIAARR
jgi:hypothetical protein